MQGNLDLQIVDYANEYREALRAIYTSGRRGAFPWMAPQIYQPADFDRDTAGEKIWVALSKQTVAGFLSCWEADHFIHCLYVKPEFHRAGIGKALMQVCLDHVGLPATLKCIIANTDAIAFYQKLGWEIAGTGDSEEGPYALMRLDSKQIKANKASYRLP